MSKRKKDSGVESQWFTGDMKVRDKSDLSVSSCMLLKAMGRSPIVRDLYSYSII